MHAPVLVQQLTHQHPDRSSIAFRTCFGKFADKTGKIHNSKQTKHNGKPSKTVSFFQKSNDVNMNGPDQTACSAP